MCLITSTLHGYVLTSVLVGRRDGGDVTSEMDSKTQYKCENPNPNPNPVSSHVCGDQNMTFF